MSSSSAGMMRPSSTTGRSLSHPRASSSSSSSSSSRGGGGGHHHPALARNASSTPKETSSNLATSTSASKQQHQQVIIPSAITTMASPTSSASSSICSSSPPSSSGGGRGDAGSDECDCDALEECDEEHDEEELYNSTSSLHQVMMDDDDNDSKYPSNSTIQRNKHTHHSSTCRAVRRSSSSDTRSRNRARRTHHSRNPQHHTLQTSTSSLTSTTHPHQAHQQQPLFSPITSNGSVISNTSSGNNKEHSTNSNPASPLKSSIGSLLPPVPFISNENVNEGSSESQARAEGAEGNASSVIGKMTGETGSTDSCPPPPPISCNDEKIKNAATDDETMDDVAHPPPGSTSSTSTTPNEVTHSTEDGSTADAGADGSETMNRQPSNPRKSARRHSENGMKTPDESIYAQLPFGPSTSSTTSTSTIPSSFAAERFAVPSSSMGMGSRTVSTPAYIHSGTPAVTSTSSNVPLYTAPVVSLHQHYEQQNPGERRIANETTRPARRKVHRVDYGGQNERSVSNPGTLRTSSSSSITGQETPNLNGPDRVVDGTTFQNARRPNSNAESYFPLSHHRSQAAFNSHTRGSNNTSASGAAAAGSGRSSAGPQQHASMAFDHHHHAARSNIASHTTQSANPTQQQQLSSSFSSTTSSPQAAQYEQHQSQKASKQLKIAKQMKEIEANMPHMDIATFPTNTLLQLLAALLSKITAVNDAIRDGEALPSSSPTSSSAEGDKRSKMEEGGDSNMEGDENKEEGSGNGTITPPSQSHGHSRNGSSEPVTPAVPFPSPTMTRVASTSSSSRKEDAFAHDARLTESSAHSSPESKIHKSSQKEVGDELEEEEALKPRHNFYRPPSPVQSSRTQSGVTSMASTQVKPATNQIGSMNSRPTPGNQRTILTSAAQALATPNATLCFHARNIPSISIEAYLIRISKYCPTTNEVFISLLVYFDRMSRLPNLSNLTSSLPSSSSSTNLAANRDTQAGSTSSNPANPAAVTATSQGSQPLSSTSSSSIPSTHSRTRSSSNPVETSHTPVQHSHHSTFAVDSFNIHRLIIAGITVASKFFSDVFYTNSRYAKVGGLPLSELNALELQFLLLNGFDLIVSPEELQRYADYLLTGALPPLATDSSDRFGSRYGHVTNTNGRATTTPIDTPPASRSVTPSRSRATSGNAGHGLFGQALRQNRTQHEQAPGGVNQHAQPTSSRAYSTTAASSSVHSTPSDTHSHQTHSTFPSSMIDATSSRPKTSTRSASESSTSASEASTVVPSESSVDTERGEVDHSTADEDTGVEDDEDIDGDSRMTDVSGAPSPAVVSQTPSFAQMQAAASQQQHQQLPSNAMYPSNASLGADRDGFAIPARPRPSLSRTSSGGSGQRHPLLAASAGNKTPSNGGSSGGHSSGGKTSAAPGSVNNIGIKASTGKVSTSKANASTHRRDNSRTREWTLQQQQQMQQRGSALADEDADMADEE